MGRGNEVFEPCPGAIYMGERRRLHGGSIAFTWGNLQFPCYLHGGTLLGRYWAVLGRSWSLLGRSWVVLGRSWAVLSRSWSPLTPPAASEQSPVNAFHFLFSLLKLPKALLTSLHCSSLFLSRLGSLLGSVLAPSWAPFWPNFGPSRLLKPYLFQTC